MRLWNVNAECPRCRAIDWRVKSGWLLDRKIGRFRNFEYFVDIERSPAGLPALRRCHDVAFGHSELPGAIVDVPFRPWRLLPAAGLPM